jgi:hypothetical protein
VRPASWIAASGVVLSNHVSVKIMQQQRVKVLCAVSRSLISSSLFRIERTLARKIEGSGGLDGLAFSRARTPARFPRFCFRSQRLLCRPVEAELSLANLRISGGMDISLDSRCTSRFMTRSSARLYCFASGGHISVKKQKTIKKQKRLAWTAVYPSPWQPK